MGNIIIFFGGTGIKKGIGNLETGTRISCEQDRVTYFTGFCIWCLEFFFDLSLTLNYHDFKLNCYSTNEVWVPPLKSFGFIKSFI